MQICPRLACKIACFCRQKYMQLTGKNTGIAGKNTQRTQSKITANACNLLSHRGYTHSRLAGKLRALLRAIAFTLREVPAADKQVNLSVFTSNLHVTQVNCVWALFTCVFPLVKIPAFAGNAIVSKIYRYLR